MGPLPPQAETAPVAKKLFSTLAILAVLFLTFAAYFNALNNDFIWDDEFLIRDNTAIKSFANAAGIFKTYLAATSGNINNFYRPIQELSYMVDHFLWGRAPAGFHLTNILLHALCACFLYALSLRIMKDPVAAFMTAALFGVHPVNTEAVTYVAGRADSLYLLFFLISFVLFLRATETPGKDNRIGYVPYALSVFSYSLSIMSKEIGIILPVFLVLYIFVISDRHKRARLYPLIVPYVLVFFVYVILRKTVLDFSGIAPSTILAQFGLYTRMLTTCKAVCVYLFMLAMPFGLHMERKVKVPASLFEPEAIIAVAAILVIAAAIYLSRKSSKKALFASLWFFIGLFPVSNIIPINSFIAEHWLYLPAIGVYMLTGLAVARLFYGTPQKPAPAAIKALAVAVSASLLIFFSVLTHERNKDWKDGITFFKNTLKYSPNNARLHLNFGNVYYHEGKVEDALREYRKAIELRPVYAEAYSNIAGIYIERGDYKEAKGYLEKALSLMPSLPKAQAMMKMIKGR